MNPSRSAPPTTPNRVPRPSRLAFVAAAWSLALGLAAPGQEPPKAPPPGMVIHLAPGGFKADQPGGSPGFASGGLEDSDRRGVVRWRSDAFASPLEFPIDRVASVRFPDEGPSPKPPGAFGFELTGGGVLFGSIVALDDKTAELDVAHLARIRVDRPRLRRIYRWRDGSDLIYNGPTGLSGWREVQPPKARPDRAAGAGGAIILNGVVNGRAAVANAGGVAPGPAPAEPAGPLWREELGQLATDKEDAILQGDVGLPGRASIELELSWKSQPNFTVAFGVDDDEATVGRAFRLEVWDGQIVLLRETDKEADLAPIQAVGAGPGRVHLRAFLDQERGRFLVVAEDGSARADLTLGGRPGDAPRGIRLVNHSGDLRLERLRIDRWDGESMIPADAGASRIRLADGSADSGMLERFDPDTREFVVRGEEGESRIAEDRLADVRLAGPADDDPRPVHALYRDGTRFGGSWDGVAEKALLLSAPGVAGTLRLPLDGLRSLDMPARTHDPEPQGDPVGILEMDGLRLAGRLEAPAGGDALAWKPLGSESASPIRPGGSGRIVYRDKGSAMATSPASTPNRMALGGMVIGGGGVVGIPAQPRAGMAAAPALPRAVLPRMGGDLAIDATRRTTELVRSSANYSPRRRSLYLRTGDIIPSEVTKIDEEGVTIRSDVSEKTFVPHAKIKAVVLAAEFGAVIRVDPVRRDRLLTLPRMQKGSPPTHLIRSTTGDILRGRLLAMDDKTIRVEVRLKEMELPRDRVSRIIWLHADETDTDKDKDKDQDQEREQKPPPDVAAANRVQAVLSDGIRITFVADRVEGGAVAGRSDVLGACKVRLQELDQLLIGGAVEAEATQLAYQQWKLQDAPEPKSALADGGAGGEAAGTESALVGQAAPDFTLDLLGGGKFHLAEAKGKVILLDFWATWCGPCVQAMPQVEAVAREWEDKGLKLVAVNLQEAPPKITAMLERLKLSPAVALDRDGAVAEKYGANAIPQTVIIDREGKVFRLYVGGGPHLGDQLREALKAVIEGEKP